MRPIFLLFLSFSLACGQAEFVVGPENNLEDRKVREPTQSEESANNKVIAYPQPKSVAVWYGHSLAFVETLDPYVPEIMANLDTIQESGIQSFLSFSVLTDHDTYSVFNVCAHTRTLRPIHVQEFTLYSEEISYKGSDWYAIDRNAEWLGLPHVGERVCAIHYYDELYDLELTKRFIIQASEAIVDRSLYKHEQIMMTDMLDFQYYIEEALPNKTY